jgi:hypothetical protein
LAARLYNEPIGSIQATDVGAWIQYATQILDAAERALAQEPANPPGSLDGSQEPATSTEQEPARWKLVPVEITEDMHVAAVRTIVRCSGNDDFPPRVWRAMLAAAPQPPAASPPERMITGALLRRLFDALPRDELVSEQDRAAWWKHYAASVRLALGDSVGADGKRHGTGLFNRLWLEAIGQQEIDAVTYFARLIAEECAKACDPWNPPSDWTEYAKVKAECAAVIRATFGGGQ